jgi:hypothetical protein
MPVTLVQAPDDAKTTSLLDDNSGGAPTSAPLLVSAGVGTVGFIVGAAPPNKRSKPTAMVADLDEDEADIEVVCWFPQNLSVRVTLDQIAPASPQSCAQVDALLHHLEAHSGSEAAAMVTAAASW